ncbi:MAG: xanthine dehydrogenase family protein molybdopterin-binding subunit [Candidatus Lustribacter sp.]|jgi:xanthine dehydrogenase YagR molybdenum-binding subunit
MTDDEILRTERFPVGISSMGVSEAERRIPFDEPAPLAPNDELQVIGKPVPRVDAVAKVTGAARFTVDVKLPHMLHARILRAPMPHARVRAIDASAAIGLPGVRAVDIIANPNAPSTATIHYAGEPIAAVAATDAGIAEAALALIRVEYEALPFVVDLDEARETTAPRVYQDREERRALLDEWVLPYLPRDGNVQQAVPTGNRGDVEGGLLQADVIVSGDYRTSVQTHCCLEPHAIVADWRSDGLTVYASTQFTAGVRATLAQEFALPLNRVRVVVAAMGGGFGSKSSLREFGRIAVRLSRQADAPVRLVLDRKEEQLDSGNRPGTWQRLRIGARRDGSLTSLSVTSYGTAGVGTGAGVGNIAQALYTCPNFESAQYDVFVNAGPGSAMRGPGNTPGAFGLEQTIDELAERLQFDPLKLRDGIDPSPVRREERRIGAERIGWSRRHEPGADPGPVKRGLGVAQSLWSANVQTNASCEVRIYRDGAVELLSSVQDIGTGIGTILAQVVAEELGLHPDQIAVRIGDTDFPAGGPSYGSRTTASTTPPARTAAHRVREMLFQQLAVHLGVSSSAFSAHDGVISVHDDAKQRDISFREAAATLRTDRIGAVCSRRDDYLGFRHAAGPDAAIARQDLGGVQFAEVAVDTETGIVRVERVVAVQDCGRPMNPLLIESQVQGGVLMGLSYALFEERLMDRHTGLMVNPNLEQYKLAGSRETPAIEVVVLENYQGQSATDAYGIAEPSNIATAPAIANAVYNAIGVRMHELPMTPARILAALGKVPALEHAG